MLKELMEVSDIFNRKKSMRMYGIFFHIVFSIVGSRFFLVKAFLSRNIPVSNSAV